MLKDKGRKIKASLLTKLPKKPGASASSSPASASEASSAERGLGQPGTQDADSSTVIASTVVDSPSEVRGPEDDGGQRSGAAPMKVDPTVAAAVLVVALLALWRPTISLFLVSVAVNVALAGAMILQASYAQRQRDVLNAHLQRSQTSDGTEVEAEADVRSTDGLQQLLEPGWKHMREVIGQRELNGILTQIELGDTSPQVTSVRSVGAPRDGVVCFDVGLELKASSRCPLVQLEIPIPGYWVVVKEFNQNHPATDILSMWFLEYGNLS